MSKCLQLLVIGNEILSGRRQDVHFANTRAACEARGLRLAAAHFLGDDAAALVAHYRRALEAGEVVLSFGGIGATPDDRTRQAVAEACGVPLEFHPEGEALLLAKYGAADFTPARRELIHFPQGASLIPNPVNGIPGFSLHSLRAGLPADGAADDGLGAGYVLPRRWPRAALCGAGCVRAGKPAGAGDEFAGSAFPAGGGVQPAEAAF